MNDLNLQVALEEISKLAAKLKEERDEWRKAAFQVTAQATASRKELERERDEARGDFKHWHDNWIRLRDEKEKMLARLETENAKLCEIAERALEYVGHTSVQERLLAELDQLKEGAK